MSQVISLEEPPQILGLSFSEAGQKSFLQEFVQQFRLADLTNEYQSWSDQKLMEQLVMATKSQAFSWENLQLVPLNQLLTSAFYQTLGREIERRTGHTTETFIQLKNKEFSSVVIFCGGVLVFYSLIWGYNRLNFSSSQEIADSVESDIRNAVAKASQYLDFAC